MDQNIDSILGLVAICKDGDGDRLRAFLEKTLPALPEERQKDYCSDQDGFCEKQPCHATILVLSHAASQAGQADIFTFLWDNYLKPSGETNIPWDYLREAAFRGDVHLARAFWERDHQCFRTTAPAAVHGPPKGGQSHQTDIAIRNDRFGYIDFMLDHGADLNADFPKHDILKMIVNCAVDDTTTLQRIRFLAARGVRVVDSAALGVVAAGGSVELASCLLAYGADPNNVADATRKLPLTLAFANGHQKVVNLLLSHGTIFEATD